MKILYQIFNFVGSNSLHRLDTYLLRHYPVIWHTKAIYICSYAIMFKILLFIINIVFNNNDVIDIYPYIVGLMVIYWTYHQAQLGFPFTKMKDAFTTILIYAVCFTILRGLIFNSFGLKYLEFVGALSILLYITQFVSFKNSATIVLIMLYVRNFTINQLTSSYEGIADGIVTGIGIFIFGSIVCIQLLISALLKRQLWGTEFSLNILFCSLFSMTFLQILFFTEQPYEPNLASVYSMQICCFIGALLVTNVKAYPKS
jgi:hypothetical protein